MSVRDDDDELEKLLTAVRDLPFDELQLKRWENRTLNEVERVRRARSLRSRRIWFTGAGLCAALAVGFLLGTLVSKSSKLQELESAESDSTVHFVSVIATD